MGAGVTGGCMVVVDRAGVGGVGGPSIDTVGDGGHRCTLEAASLGWRSASMRIRTLEEASLMDMRACGSRAS